MDWKRWIGLPHEFGADPCDGQAADCVLMVWRILDDADIEHPEFNAYWLEMARQKRWAELRRCGARAPHNCSNLKSTR